ncbi:MAG: hypothetical protein L3J16_02115 [Anaerolineales bacterium]|nr:hypothetical protein [Anaerolineales bacterium]
MSKEKSKMRTFEAETLALPSIKMVIGDVPVPNPPKKGLEVVQNWPGKSRSVVRLINHLDKKKE